MTTYLFISHRENYHEAAQESCFWTCSSTTETGDQILVYVTEIGIQYEWRAVSDAEKVGYREYECLVEYVRTFNPPISLDEICSLVPTYVWRPPHLNFRGYKSIRVPDDIVKQLIAGRPSYKACQIDPHSPQTYYNRGNAYADVGKYTAAINNYGKAIQRDLNFAPAYSARGFAYASEGRYKQAMADYDKAIQRDPNFALTYGYRGLTYVGQGDYTRAITDCNRAIQLDPNEAYFYYVRGIVYHSQSNFTEAITDYNRAIQWVPEESFFYSCRGTAYDRQGDGGRAIADFNKAIQLNSKDALAYYNLGALYANQRKNKEAIRNFRHALELETDSYWQEQIKRYLRKLGVKVSQSKGKAPIQQQPRLGISRVEKLVRIGADFDVVITDRWDVEDEETSPKSRN